MDKCVHLLLIGLLKYMFLIYFILLCSDGEVRVDSLSPAHTLSSAPSPCSLEALSPYSLQVSPCGLLFVLYSFLCSTFNFQCKCYHWYWLRVFTYVPYVPNIDSCSLLWGNNRHTLETLANKSLKHLVSLMMWCQSECCPHCQKGDDNFSHISII